MKNEEKVINKRIYGYIFGFFAILIFSLFWFFVDLVGIGITLVVFAVLQIGLFLITPRCYIFSQDRLVIKYFFGLEENIPWQYVRAITTRLEEPVKYYFLESYQFVYYSEEKHLFFMRGIVSKNKSTKKLMKKYCPKKFDYYVEKKIKFF